MKVEIDEVEYMQLQHEARSWKERALRAEALVNELYGLVESHKELDSINEEMIKSKDSRIEYWKLRTFNQTFKNPDIKK